MTLVITRSPEDPHLTHLNNLMDYSEINLLTLIMFIIKYYPSKTINDEHGEHCSKDALEQITQLKLHQRHYL